MALRLEQDADFCFWVDVLGFEVNVVLDAALRKVLKGETLALSDGQHGDHRQKKGGSSEQEEE